MAFEVYTSLHNMDQQGSLWSQCACLIKALTDDAPPGNMLCMPVALVRGHSKFLFVLRPDPVCRSEEGQRTSQALQRLAPLVTSERLIKGDLLLMHLIGQSPSCLFG